MINHLIKDIKRHHLSYLLLFSGLSVGLIAFFAFTGIPFLRLISVIFISAFYFFWGVGHHLVDNDWHLKIALEYLLIASLGCILLLSIMLRG